MEMLLLRSANQSSFRIPPERYPTQFKIEFMYSQISDISYFNNCLLEHKIWSKSYTRIQTDNNLQIRFSRHLAKFAKSAWHQEESMNSPSFEMLYIRNISSVSGLKDDARRQKHLQNLQGRTIWFSPLCTERRNVCQRRKQQLSKYKIGSHE